jgi:hypothetical protein
VREEGIALSGPAPAVAFPEIARSEYLAGIARYLEYLLDQPMEELSRGALAYAVLSACRGVCTIHEGKPCSKQQGAAWVRERRPDSARLIDAALACRLSRGTVGFDDDGSRRAAMELIRSLAADALP